MADIRTNYTNAYETTLSSALATGATTINVTDTTGSPAVPFYVVLDPGNDSKREVVLVDGAKTATTFTLSAATSRGRDGTSDVAHDSGAVVAIVPVAAMWNDLHDRVDGHTAAADPHADYLTAAEGNAAYVGKAGGDTITASAATVIPLVVKGAASQSGNLFEVRDSAGATLGRFTSNGRLAVETVAYVGAGAVANIAGGSLRVATGAAAGLGLAVRGEASQTANLAEFQDSAGAVLARVDPSGQIASPQAFLTANVAGTKPLVVRGAAAQTANLLEAQDSAGAQLFALKADGKAHFSATLVTTTATAGTRTLPANPVNFLTIQVGSTEYKLPYYGV